MNYEEARAFVEAAIEKIASESIDKTMQIVLLDRADVIAESIAELYVNRIEASE